MITPSKSSLPLSKPGRAKRGEIALTLTVLSFAIMLIGTMFGGIQQQQRSSTKAAGAGSCYYKATARVVINGTQNFSASQNGGNPGLWGISNNKTQTNQFLPSSTKSEYTYENPNLTFKPAPGAEYSKGEPAEVFLIGLNRDKWQVIDVHCKNNQTDKSIGCQPKTGLNISPNGAISITNIKVDCGVDIEYDFEVAPVTPENEPTPTSRPSASPTPAITGSSSSCLYAATAQVKKKDGSFFTLGENGSNPNFGVSNNKQDQLIAAGKFGTSVRDGRMSSSNASRNTPAEFTYYNSNEHFKPEYQNAPYFRTSFKPDETVNVTLIGLHGDWTVTGTDCKGIGCPTNKNQGRAFVYAGFKPDCGTNVVYEYTVERNGIDTPTPVQGRIATPSMPAKRLPISPTKTVPSVPVACGNNSGIITGKIHASTTRTLISPNSTKPNYKGSIITILACKIGANTVDCSKPYDQKIVELPDDPVFETGYSLSIPDISLNQDIAVVYRIPQEISKYVNVQMANCKASGMDVTGTQGCLVQFIPPASCTPAGPDYSVSLAIPNGMGGHIDIPATEDAWIQSLFRNKNNGSEGVFSTGTTFDSSAPVNKYGFFRSLLKFDLTSIKGVSIKKATLNMRQVSCGPGIKVISSYKNKSQWHENSVTWNNAPDFFNAKVGSDINADTCNQNDGSGSVGNPDFSSDLQTDIVQQWSDNPNANFGITIKTPENDTSLHISSVEDFFSKESVSSPIGRNPGAAKAPYLSIDYENVHPTRPANKPSTPKTPAKSPIARRDLNGDKTVNVVDFVLFLKKIGTKGRNIPEDVNNDGVVNAVDGASIIVSFGKKLD